MEKNYDESLDVEGTLKLVCKSLLDVVESGKQNIELVVVNKKEIRVLTDPEIEKLINAIEQK